MANKKKPQLSRHERRRLRIQQIAFVLIAVLIITSFVVSLVRF
jgi:predicted nucleic acid-binding Zn ribbon protein